MRRLARIWLLGIYATADTRIKNGDLDFDDIWYRTRDAARILLEIQFGRTFPDDERDEALEAIIGPQIARDHATYRQQRPAKHLRLSSLPEGEKR